MALTDPQTITVNAVAKVMPRVLNSGTSSTYRLSDLSFTLDVNHRTVVRDKKRRVISTAKFTQRKVVPDPLTSVNDYEINSSSVQFDRPEVGFTTTEMDQQWTGHKAWLDSTMFAKLMGQES